MLLHSKDCNMKLMFRGGGAHTHQIFMPIQSTNEPRPPKHEFSYKVIGTR